MSKSKPKVRGRKISVRCPSYLSDFEDIPSAYPHENEYRKSVFNGIEKNCIGHTKTFTGAYHTLLLLDGKLYGKGDNSHKQINYSDEESYDTLVYIAGNVISAAAGKEYTVYITVNGEIKILGDGNLRNSFRSISGARKVLANKEDCFLLLTADGEAYIFGNNTKGQIEKIERVEAFSKNGILFNYTWDPFSDHPLTVEETDENGNTRKRSWNKSDTAAHLKRNFSFINDEDAYLKYLKLCSAYGEENIEMEVELDTDLDSPSYFFGEFCYQDFECKADVVVYRSNRFINQPIKVDNEMLQKCIGLFFT